MDEWKEAWTLPPPGERLGRVWVIVDGFQTHSGRRWRRRRAGLARTHNEGFEAEDVARIEVEDHMDVGSGIVTHWLDIKLPNFPPTEDRS